MTIAQVILNQLGGRKFMFMTGSKNFISDKNTLHMDLQKNKSGARKLRITLNGLDLYDLEFYNKRIVNYNYTEKVLVKYDNATAEDLQHLFKMATGFYTRM